MNAEEPLKHKRDTLLYVTGNAVKFRQGELICSKSNIHLTQIKLGIPEIQAESGEPIARDKAAKAYALAHQPLVVSDDNWMIAGLKNFPGPYMKSMNDWFTAEDWLRLTDTLEDRTITLRQIVVYQDAAEQQLFSVDIPGILLHDIRGKSPYAHAHITSFDGGKHSNAEHHERGENASHSHHSPWDDFAAWYNSRNQS